MSKVDQFESVFRSAIHDVFISRQLEFKKILIISDLDSTAHVDFEDQIRQFSRYASNTSKTSDSNTLWLSLAKGDFQTTQELIDKVASLQPDLIFTYRNLQSNTWQYNHSLGEFLDALIQKTDVAIVVLPHPMNKKIKKHILKNTDVVMAITDHLSSDNDLVNYALHFTEEQGSLYLMHIEDANTFEYYMNAISKIPTIETNDARETISSQLLKAPKDYINSVTMILKQQEQQLNIHSIVGFGHHLTEYQKYISDYQVDLVVMNTKDKQQMAMHGLAYPLVVELRDIPLLLI